MKYIYIYLWLNRNVSKNLTKSITFPIYSKNNYRRKMTPPIMHILCQKEKCGRITHGICQLRSQNIDTLLQVDLFIEMQYSTLMIFRESKKVWRQLHPRTNCTEIVVIWYFVMHCNYHFVMPCQHHYIYHSGNTFILFQSPISYAKIAFQLDSILWYRDCIMQPDETK